MNKLYTTLAILMSFTMAAWGINPLPVAPQPIAPGMTEFRQTPKQQQQPRAATYADDNITWSEWETVGTASFDQAFIDWFIQIMEYNLAEVPDWDGSFTLMSRENTADPTQMQLRFADVFNHVDLFFYYDTETQQITQSEDQPIGIAQTYSGETGYYDEFAFSLYYGTNYFFPSLGNISFSNVWLKISSRMGFQYGTVHCTVDGASPLEFSIESTDEDCFYSSYQTEATFTVSRSEQVKTYRVAVFPSTMPIWLSITDELMKANPSCDYPYTDHTAASFTIPLDAYTPAYTIVSIPLGDNGSAIDNFQMYRIYSNRQEPHEWIPLGTATLTDILGSTTIYNANWQLDESVQTPQTREVQVEVRADNPYIFRICNPFGIGYPLYDRITPTDPNDDFYIIIDASDPSRVAILHSLSGISQFSYNQPATIYSYNYDEFVYSSYTTEEIDNRTPNLYGKYSDKRIVFPNGSVHLSGVVFDEPPIKDHNDIELLLPGYVDYTLEHTGSTDGGIHTLQAAQAVRSVDCALIPQDTYEANRWFPERLYAMVAERADGLLVRNYTISNGTVDVPTDELIDANTEYGSLALVAVPLDADGNTHSGIVIEKAVKNTHPEDSWELLGKARFEDYSLYGLWDGLSDYNPYISEVDIYEHTTHKGFYKLIRPYEQTDTHLGTTNDYQYERDLYIDATDPAHVNIVGDYLRNLPESLLGVGTGVVFLEQYGEQTINTLVNYYTIEDPSRVIEKMYGIKVENVIRFDADQLLSGLTLSNEVFYAGGGFTITLPDGSGITVTEGDNEADGDAPAEYFNLQGMRVANPSGGIFIERRGTKVTKRYIP